MTDLMHNEEFETAVEKAFRLDLAAKLAKEAADEAREEVKQMIMASEGKSYEGGTSKFRVSMFPTRRFNVALALKKLDPEAIEAVSSMQIDKKLVDALIPKEYIQTELSTESAPTLKIALP